MIKPVAPNTLKNIAFKGYLKTYDLTTTKTENRKMSAKETSSAIDIATEFLPNKKSNGNLLDAEKSFFTLKIIYSDTLKENDVLQLTTYNKELGQIYSVEVSKKDAEELEKGYKTVNLGIAKLVIGSLAGGSKELKKSLNNILEHFPKVEMPQWVTDFVTLKQEQ